MAPENLDRFLDNFDPGRRNFLRRIIAGAAFAPPLIASFSLAGPSLTSAEAGVPTSYCANQSPVVEFFDFSGTEYQDNFRGILRPTEINPGLDPVVGGHPALKFTGSIGSAGSTWLTVFEATAPLPEDGCLLSLSADILFHTFNNSKGAGLLALFNETAGKKGLALLVFNAGNTDTLQLVTIDQAGNVATIPGALSVPLGARIVENVWYRLTMDITTQLTTVSVTGKVFRHVTPTSPNSPPEVLPFGTLVFNGQLPSGVDSSGEVGLVARAVNAVVDLSMTNYTITFIEFVPA